MLFVSSAVFVILFRNNGKYIIYPMLMILIVILWKNDVLFRSRQHTVRIAICMILSVFIPFIISFSLVKVYHIISVNCNRTQLLGAGTNWTNVGAPDIEIPDPLPLPQNDVRQQLPPRRRNRAWN